MAIDEDEPHTTSSTPHDFQFLAGLAQKTMLEGLPNDVLQNILYFLTNDGISVGRLSLCSRDLWQKIARDNSPLWQAMVNERWSSSATRIAEDDNEQKEEPRSTYIRRHGLDKTATKLIDKMANDLRRVVRRDSSGDRLNENFYVGQAWDHEAWTRLLELRGDVLDTLREQAREALPSTGNEGLPHSFESRLRAFLAARSLQALHFAENLFEWRNIFSRIARHRSSNIVQNGGQTPHIDAGELLEDYALLINEIQQTPRQLVLVEQASIRLSVKEAIDNLAEISSRRIHHLQTENNEILCTLDKIRIINEDLFHTHGFEGNTDDYYNYRNSLLDQVLKTKKGIPMTLAILYSCVCRRLDIQVSLVGLPGHIVSSFYTEDGTRCFVDVFHRGKLLSEDGCRRICGSYNVPFQENFLAPMAPGAVLQRILNNLSNCHLHGMSTAGNMPFHSDLFFHQRALASIHRQPDEIALTLVDRVTQELPLTLSPDLLRMFDLLLPPTVEGA